MISLRRAASHLVWLAASVACSRGDAPAPHGASRSAASKPTTAALAEFAPPSDSAIPAGPMGESVRRGLALLTHTTDSLPAYAPGNIQCTSCHLDGGRRKDAAPLVGVVARYPRFVDRSGAVASITDRINFCFTRSLSGRRLPDDSREMHDIVSYLSFISDGVPVGRHVPGEGFPVMPPLVGDTARGAAIYASTCVPCHGSNGAGTKGVVPALWGPTSFSIGASMAREERAASFIRRFMPKSNPGSLTDQQAWDVSAYVNSRARPDMPGKAQDWPNGGAPRDVPYATTGRPGYRPPAALLPRKNPELAYVPPARSVAHPMEHRP